MSLMRVKPKNGWINATDMEIEMECCNVLSEKYNLRARNLFEELVKAGISVRHSMHLLVGRGSSEGARLLFEFIFDGRAEELKNYLNE